MGRYRWTHLLQKDYQDRPPFEVPRSVQHCTSRLLYGQFPNKEILCCRGNCRINWTQRVQTELQGHAVLGNRKVRYDRRRYWPRPRWSHANHRVLAQRMGSRTDQPRRKFHQWPMCCRYQANAHSSNGSLQLPKEPCGLLDQGCSYPYPYPVGSSSATETPKRGKTRAPRTRMNRPRMMAFWMEVALKVKVVAPPDPTLINPNLASPFSSTSSSALEAANKARQTTVEMIHFMVMSLGLGFFKGRTFRIIKLPLGGAVGMTVNRTG